MFSSVPLRALATHSPANCLAFGRRRCLSLSSAATQPPGELLQQRFQPIAGDKCPLFRDWETYEKSLPVGQVGGKIVGLHTLPHWCREADVQLLADQLDERPSLYSRGLVNYGCGPLASGKSKSALPAFLKSGIFTRYVYISFANNDGRYFQAHDVSHWADTAAFQGETFMLQVLTRALKDPDNCRGVSIDVETEEPCHSDPDEVLRKLLNDCFGNDEHILVHVDEPSRMGDCKPKFTGSEFSKIADPGLRFIRGAMEVLCHVRDKVTILITDLNPPPIFPLGRSTIYRRPVALPQIDPNMVLQDVVGATFAAAKDKDEHRQWATLMLQLQCAFRWNAGELHMSPPGEKMQALLDTLKKNVGADKPDFRECIEACRPITAAALEATDGESDEEAYDVYEAYIKELHDE